MKICSINDCQKETNAFNLCINHYRRMKKHGSPYITKTERHGQSKTPEYATWCSMKYRCYNVKSKNYKDYGGRGITICDEWQKFSQFKKDMGTKPSGYYTIERIDNNKGYSPENCRWATIQEQQKNRRKRRTKLELAALYH